jgi:hypothetical protein
VKTKSIARGMAGVVCGAGLAICCFSIPGFTAPGDAPSDDSAAAAAVRGAELNRKLPEIVPGKSTKAQVVALLGRPWRTVQYNDLDELEDEIWEYRGTDAQGPFRVHIEFDRQDVVHIAGKISDRGSGSDGTPARSAPSTPPR